MLGPPLVSRGGGHRTGTTAKVGVLKKYNVAFHLIY